MNLRGLSYAPRFDTEAECLTAETLSYPSTKLSEICQKDISKSPIHGFKKKPNFAAKLQSQKEKIKIIKLRF